MVPDGRKLAVERTNSLAKWIVELSGFDAMAWRYYVDLIGIKALRTLP